jgi:spore germination cell wall hydrolase CwlJ-like protein
MLMEMALVLAIKNSPHSAVAKQEHKCLVDNIIYEASNQGTKGMRLVTEVTLNRIANKPNAVSMCEVVYEPSQFSWTSTKKENLRKYTKEEENKAYQILYSYLYGDLNKILPSNVLNYLNTKIATDLSWYTPDKVIYRYKDHTFLANVR